MAPVSPVGVDLASVIDKRPSRAAGMLHAMRETPRERRYRTRALLVTVLLMLVVAFIMDTRRIYLPGPFWVRALVFAAVLFAGQQVGYYLARMKERAELSDQHHQ